MHGAVANRALPAREHARQESDSHGEGFSKPAQQTAQQRAAECGICVVRGQWPPLQLGFQPTQVIG